MMLDRSTIQRALDDEDIEDLLRTGAPRDEYEAEGRMIHESLSAMTGEWSEQATVATIEQIWDRQFGPFAPDELQRRREAFERIARRIIPGAR